MINVYECLTDDAKIYLTKDYNYRRSFFKRKDDELYIKEFNHAEFIGEQLCLIKNIKCAHYFLVGLGLFNLNYSEKYGNISDKNYQIKLASYNFKEDDKKYFILNGCNITSENSKLDEVLNLAVDDLKKFVSMYPNFKDDLESYLDINLVRNAKYAYELRNLNLPRDILNYLDEFQTDRKKLIKEIIN